MGSRARTSELLAPIVLARARVLAPAVLAALVFFVATSRLFGIDPDARSQEMDWLICVAMTALTAALVLRRVPERLAHVASAASLWLPMVASLVPLYATGNPVYEEFLLVEIACAGVLLDTRWTVATLVAALALAVTPLVIGHSPHAAFRVATLVTAGLFALLIHALMKRALEREARAARELARELDERARLQEQLFHAQRMDALGTLAAGIAHDMNNVLGSITSFAGLLAEGPAGEGDEIRHIVAQAERGAALTRGLLAFSRRGPYRKQVVRIGDVIRDIMPLLVRALPKTVTIRNEVIAADACVDADPAHLGQVLVNLGMNAADAMDGVGTLVIATDMSEGSVRLRVTDTGAGMDEATRQRIFEPFFTTKPAGRGTGLGLSTVWGIVHAHGGTIDVDSQPGRGSTFTVLLPPSMSGPTPTPRRLPTGPIQGDRTVLVVDDEPAIRASTKRLLERIGIAVELASDGVEALRILESRGPEIDAVILDMGMPNMGGAECFRRIRATSAIPVLLATGYAAEGELDELVAAGVQVLEKPFPPDELRRRIVRLLDGAKGDGDP